MKEYKCICPVCKKFTILEADFFSSGIYIEKEGKGYPSTPCPNTHKANEVRRAIGLPDLEEKYNHIVKGATRIL